jgi:predicted dehydrogenase
MKILRIGMAGLDTSHAPAFASLLHDGSHEYHVPGARIVAAYPGGSPDFDLSIGRVAQFTATLRDQHGVEIVDSLAGLREKCDAVMLESIDGRVHLEQFREVAHWGIPVFIDKPLTLSAVEAREIARIAGEAGVRVTSASAMRFAEKFREALESNVAEPVIGADFHGPMAYVEKSPGYFWYGIHSVEMLFAAMGSGCREVLAVREELHDILIGRWADGRLGVVRGNRAGSGVFGGMIHRKPGSASFDVSAGKKPYYASLLDKVIPFFRGEGEVVALPEMVEVISFLESANRSAETKEWTAIQC